MRFSYLLLFCFLLAGCALSNHTEDGLYTPDPQATAAAPWEVGEIVDSGTGIFELQMYRAFVGVNSKGEFLTQAFYEKSNMPYTSVMRIKNEEDVTQPIFFYCDLSTIGTYIQYSPMGHKLVEGSCNNGEKVGVWSSYNLEGELQFKEEFASPSK